MLSLGIIVHGHRVTKIDNSKNCYFAIAYVAVTPLRFPRNHLNITQYILRCETFQIFIEVNYFSLRKLEKVHASKKMINYTSVTKFPEKIKVSGI